MSVQAFRITNRIESFFKIKGFLRAGFFNLGFVSPAGFFEIASCGAQAFAGVDEHTAYRVVVKRRDVHGMGEPKVGVEVFGFKVVKARFNEP